MYLSDISIEGYRLFNKTQLVHFTKGLNVLIGENGCGKSTIINAIRLLLNEDEYARNGIKEEDFYSSVDKKERVDKICIKGKFSDLSEEKKVEYITWLDKNYSAVLNIDVIRKQDRRNNYKKTIWGGESSNSIFEWEPLNDIQCVYLPPLRDAEKKLKESRGSRLARLLINLSRKTLEDKRKNGELMDIEKDVNNFNTELSKRSDIAKANSLINESLKNALGSVYSQTIRIQFGDVTFEKIVEALRIVFFPGETLVENDAYRNLFENSLGYNNLIYLATILAEFEGLKENYSSPRILLIEELEAHLHPQIQTKVLKYLKEQSLKNDIQIIITSHSTTIASATPIDNIICFNSVDRDVKITSLGKCVRDEKTKRFINRWMDVTRSTLFFSKGNILVEGLAEALLIPKMAEIYLKELKKDSIPKSLEEAGVSVINMNGIFFNYFMKLYDGYVPIYPERKKSENKKEYTERLALFKKKEHFEEDEYLKTDYLPILCVAITDNDPIEDEPDKNIKVEGKNPKLYLKKQLSSMTKNCRVFSNLKTFEYDIALEKENAIKMIEIILEELPTNGSIKDTMTDYLRKINNDEDVDMPKIANDILKQIDSDYLGKGLFAQLLLEKICETNNFIIPSYIKSAFKFILRLDEENNV